MSQSVCNPENSGPLADADNRLAEASADVAEAVETGAVCELRRSGGDRRRQQVDRRRNGNRYFELRARRDGVAGDRRRSDRRGGDRQANTVVRSWLDYWRRQKV